MLAAFIVPRLATLSLILLIVVCGGGGHPAESTTSAAASPSFAAVDEWLAASPEPPVGCQTSPTVSVRGGVAPGIRMGPVYLVTAPVAGVNPASPAAKALFIVDKSAGERVSVVGRNRTTGSALYFLTGDRNGDLDVDRLVLDGPFLISSDAAHSQTIPSDPGCYDLTATWDSGSASAVVYYYGDPVLCLPTPCASATYP